MTERYNLENTKEWLIKQIKKCKTCDDLDLLIYDSFQDMNDIDLSVLSKINAKANSAREEIKREIEKDYAFDHGGER